MARLDKSAAKGEARKATADATRNTQAQAERLGRSISESAQQIWLAGMGAFNRAQSEGSKLFESLVSDGLSLEQTARKFAGSRADVVREALGTTIGHARERASGTWDNLEKVFDDRVRRALVRLDMPGREDLSALSARVERLTTEVRKVSAGTAKVAKSVRKPAAASPAAKVAASPGRAGAAIMRKGKSAKA